MYELYPHQKKALDFICAGKAEFYIPLRIGKSCYMPRNKPRDSSTLKAHYAMYGRKHKKKRWMSETYHKRIQKKWDKRYGLGILNNRVKADLSKSIEQILKTAPYEKIYKPEYGSSFEAVQSQSRILRTCIRKPVEIIELTPELLEKLKPNFTPKGK